MRKTVFDIPAISPEIAFVRKYMNQVEAVEDAGTIARPSIVSLTKKISDRADTDVLELLGEMKAHLDRGVQSMLRIEWGKYPKLGDWDVEVEFFNAARGRRKKLGLVGLMVGYVSWAPENLVAWVYPPRGGRPGLKSFVRRCRKKMPNVALASQKYGWDGNDECVIWFEKKLTLKTLRDELGSEIEVRARQFFKIAKPLLKTLADGEDLGSD
jgi:hypothetical protein